MEDGAEDTEEYDAKDETERHSTVMDAVLPTRSSLRNVFRRARKFWGISMIKLVDFGTSFGTSSVPNGTDEVAAQEDASDEVSDENNNGEDEDGDEKEGEEEEEGEEGEEETEEADEGEADEEEVQGDEADSDGEQEIDLDEE